MATCPCCKRKVKKDNLMKTESLKIVNPTYEKICMGCLNVLAFITEESGVNYGERKY